MLEGIAKRGFRGGCLRPCVNHLRSGRWVFRPRWNEPPSHRRQFANRFLRILADHRNRLSRRDVVARRPVIIPRGTVEIFLDSKRLTNTPVRQAGPVLKCPDDRKSRVVSAQATYPCGSSAVGGRVCEQRYAPQRVLPESRFELQHTGSPSQETALEEKA